MVPSSNCWRGGLCTSLRWHMRTLTAFSAAFALMVLSSSALAQGQNQKRSCQEVCVERCQTSIRKDYCLGNCPARCQMIRSEKAKSKSWPSRLIDRPGRSRLLKLAKAHSGADRWITHTPKHAAQYRIAIDGTFWLGGL